jgi:NitT/TauT family transport system substrate-binding protein
MQKDPAKAAVIIAKALEISLDDLKEQLPSIENPTLEHAGDVFQKSEALPSLYASGKLIGEILLHEKQIDHIPPIENTYNASFVAALQSRKGE